jgi:hypothetical protein
VWQHPVHAAECTFIVRIVQAVRAVRVSHTAAHDARNPTSMVALHVSIIVKDTLHVPPTVKGQVVHKIKDT